MDAVLQAVRISKLRKALQRIADIPAYPDEMPENYRRTHKYKKAASEHINRIAIAALKADTQS